MSEPPPIPILPYGTVPAPSRRGKGFLAVCATFIVPGLGHLIAGAYRRALLWFIIWLALTSAAIGLVYLPHLLFLEFIVMPLFVLSHIAAYIDAYLTGRRSPREPLRWPAARYIIGLLLVFISFYTTHRLDLYSRAHWVEAFVASSQSMRPTLQPGDRFLVAKIQSLQRWEIVVFDSTFDKSGKWVQRVVGLPGETVEVVADGLKINGQKIPLPPGLGPYVQPQFGSLNGCYGNPIHLGPGEYYVLGDNSPISEDSRYWNESIDRHQLGTVPINRILGVVTAIYWPPIHWKQFTQ